MQLGLTGGTATGGLVFVAELAGDGLYPGGRRFSNCCLSSRMRALGGEYRQSKLCRLHLSHGKPMHGTLLRRHESHEVVVSLSGSKLCEDVLSVDGNSDWLSILADMCGRILEHNINLSSMMKVVRLLKRRPETEIEDDIYQEDKLL